MSVAKSCKYECGTLIQWDTAKSIFTEQNGIPHTKERCASLKQKSTTAQPEPKSDYAKMHEENIQASRELVAAIKELAVAIKSKRAE